MKKIKLYILLFLSGMVLFNSMITQPVIAAAPMDAESVETSDNNSSDNNQSEPKMLKDYLHEVPFYDLSDEERAKLSDIDKKIYEAAKFLIRKKENIPSETFLIVSSNAEKQANELKQLYAAGFHYIGSIPAGDKFDPGNIGFAITIFILKIYEMFNGIVVFFTYWLMAFMTISDSSFITGITGTVTDVIINTILGVDQGFEGAGWRLIGLFALVNLVLWLKSQKWRFKFLPFLKQCGIIIFTIFILCTVIPNSSKIVTVIDKYTVKITNTITSAIVGEEYDVEPEVMQKSIAFELLLLQPYLMRTFDVTSIDDIKPYRSEAGCPTSEVDPSKPLENEIRFYNTLSGEGEVVYDEAGRSKDAICNEYMASRHNSAFPLGHTSFVVSTTVPTALVLLPSLAIMQLIQFVFSLIVNLRLAFAWTPLLKMFKGEGVWKILEKWFFNMLGWLIAAQGIKMLVIILLTVITRLISWAYTFGPVGAIVVGLIMLGVMAWAIKNTKKLVTLAKQLVKGLLQVAKAGITDGDARVQDTLQDELVKPLQKEAETQNAAQAAKKAEKKKEKAKNKEKYNQYNLDHKALVAETEYQSYVDDLESSMKDTYRLLNEDFEAGATERVIEKDLRAGYAELANLHKQIDKDKNITPELKQKFERELSNHKSKLDAIAKTNHVDAALLDKETQLLKNAGNLTYDASSVAQDAQVESMRATIQDLFSKEQLSGNASLTKDEFESLAQKQLESAKNLQETIAKDAAYNDAQKDKLVAELSKQVEQFKKQLPEQLLEAERFEKNKADAIRKQAEFREKQTVKKPTAIVKDEVKGHE